MYQLEFGCKAEKSHFCHQAFSPNTWSEIATCISTPRVCCLSSRVFSCFGEAVQIWLTLSHEIICCSSYFSLRRQYLESLASRKILEIKIMSSQLFCEAEPCLLCHPWLNFVANTNRSYFPSPWPCATQPGNTILLRVFVVRPFGVFW